MRKLFASLTALVLVFACLSALAAPEDFEGQILPDFSVTALDGGTFTLSESLRTHDLVLINLWATWCGPCRMEFPALEEAWQQYGSRVDVIALSVEESDTADVLRQFAEENGLHFAIGRDETDLFSYLGGYAIPTTLIVNREMRVVAVEIGAKTSAGEFTALFDSLLAQYGAVEEAAVEASEAGDAVISLRFCDPDGAPVSGVSVGFCNGEYTPVETDGDGRVSFDGSLEEYHIHLLDVPAGYQRPWEEIFVTGTSVNLTVTLPRAE